MNRKMIIIKNIPKTITATRFSLSSHQDYFYRNEKCLKLKNMINQERIDLIVREKYLEIIPDQVRTVFLCCI